MLFPENQEVHSMEKILIVGCKKAVGDVCIGCSRCMEGFNRREGTFSRYKDLES